MCLPGHEVLGCEFDRKNMMGMGMDRRDGDTAGEEIGRDTGVCGICHHL